MKVGRRATFNSAHRLFNPKWSDERNNELYGKCNNPNFHGHNYVLEVWLDGPIDPETGYVVDMKDLKAVIKTEIEDRFDHRNLNLDCPEFANLIPTAENIALVCWQLIRPHFSDRYNLEVKLWETDKNMVFYDGSPV